jgi:hypothetical protein
MTRKVSFTKFKEDGGYDVAVGTVKYVDPDGTVKKVETYDLLVWAHPTLPHLLWEVVQGGLAVARGSGQATGKDNVYTAARKALR